MPETVLEASWRLKRQVKMLYYRGAEAITATGHLVDLKPGQILFRALGGFEFVIEIGNIIQLDGRNPQVPDSPTAPEPSKERVVFYCAGKPPEPNQVLSIQGQVFEERNGTIRVETSDDREFFIPRHFLVRIENPGEHIRDERIAGLEVKGQHQPKTGGRRTTEIKR